MEQATASLIVTDDNAIKLAIFLFISLFSIISVLVGWFFKKIFSEIKSGRLESVELIKSARLESVELTNQLKYKFRALNSYAKEHDRRSIVHSEKISNLDRETQDYKKKTEEHAIVLARHDTEITNLKHRRP